MARSSTAAPAPLTPAMLGRLVQSEEEMAEVAELLWPDRAARGPKLLAAQAAFRRVRGCAATYRLYADAARTLAAQVAVFPDEQVAGDVWRLALQAKNLDRVHPESLPAMLFRAAELLQGGREHTTARLLLTLFARAAEREAVIF